MAAALDCASSTSTAFTTGWSSYDVFLNFRGEDIRNNFTGFLNLILIDKGIDVFIDSEKLWTGEAIDPALGRAIDGSKISIPVFSQGYADSKWCLLELAQIYECHESNRQLVLPIFFNIEPSHVRNQTGNFEEAFGEHEKNFEPHTTESWRKALKEIGSLKGEVIDKNR
ncbi:disease resistance protein L6-like [Telopea speciosissima]|uniref:disease resistance protein L6-like n=1 Tax=Telopea speciosissima TaxID=54955 RepID=UPI001CC5238B|nr:disease resistance protein L6-like [Telopea speciosissima]